GRSSSSTGRAVCARLAPTGPSALSRASARARASPATMGRRSPRSSKRRRTSRSGRTAACTSPTRPTSATAGSFSGENGPATQATLDNPTGVDVAQDGTLYIADRDNGRIRQVSPSGTIVTIAGSGPGATSTGNGRPATAATLGSPTKVRVGPDGSVFIAETVGNVVRRVGPEGIIHPVAGTGTAGYGTDGFPATSANLNGPTDVAFGPNGSLYVVDKNNVVREVTSRGTIATVAGTNGTSGFSGDNGLATAATMGTSQGLRAAPDGSIYIATTADNRVRRVRNAFDRFSGSTAA